MVEQEKADTLTKQERELRKRFVSEYLTDFDPVSATIRLGYSESFAVQYAKKFMTESYTLKLIAEGEIELGLTTEEEKHRQRVLAGLYREAHSRFNSGAARVAALGQIAKIVGLEAPVKTQQLLPKVGNVDLSKLSNDELEVLEKLVGKADATAQPG